jgi:hypothetical protein
MLAGFRRLSVGIMWYVEGISEVYIRRVVFDSVYLLSFEITQRYGQYKYKVINSLCFESHLSYTKLRHQRSTWLIFFCKSDLISLLVREV